MIAAGVTSRSPRFYRNEVALLEENLEDISSSEFTSLIVAYDTPEGYKSALQEVVNKQKLMIRQGKHLVRAGFPLATETAKQCGQVTRLLRRLHVHQLVAKIPRSRRWRVSRNGSLPGRTGTTSEKRLTSVGYTACLRV